MSRPYHYGLAAGGERGVERVIDILTAELDRTLAFLGCTSVAELHPGLVRLPSCGHRAMTPQAETSG